MYFYKLILLICIILSHLVMMPTEAAKILGIFTIQSRSHHIINQSIVKGLAARGHEVTVISHFKSDHTLSNYTEIVLASGGHENYIDSISVDNNVGYKGFVNGIKLAVSVESSFCDEVFGLEYVKRLIDNAEEKTVDLIIVEIFFTQCYHLLAEKLNIPLILVVPHTLGTGVDYFIGNPHNPSFTPIFLSAFTTKMSFLQRLENAAHYFEFYCWYQSFVFNKLMERYARDVFNMTLPSNEMLNKRAVLAFYNNHLSFISRPKSPNAIDIAGIHIKKSKKLPRDIEEFIEGSDHGVILFSFGGVIKASSMSADKLKMITDAFSAIPQRVLWRVNDLNLTQVPPNVKLGKWFPQRDILEHENVIAFISHCGLLGISEAFHTATPIIGIPFIFDQFQNANLLEEKEVGIHVDFLTMDKNTLINAINEVVTNTKYRENMRKLSNIFNDRPISPLDEAMYWSEYVLKHRGAAHLRTKMADMPLYQYLLLDVFLFVSSVILGIVCILKLVFKLVILLICQLRKEKGKVQ